ncbi:DUF4019 domain-containing protein [Qipengyuania sp. 6B39]|uniref:helix-turn-helix domain-containing protein n=1 Tax=Qipengyuania proteolytica TaxID=2867239 RepID=UPI001C8A67CA|nr:DUF4019 domain-containing protein [Qipengyuania proteolytica]MBX7494772.1 DUF4019 domain-containing protein [Qipengyuania proteolytica]
MVEALDDLTDKEKETLRLIVRGHDAKSMASELDLSVHTINERLRVARRKLGVTSSREAARLLFERERGTYENLADKDLGDDRSLGSGEADGVATGRPARRILAGVIVMMTIFAAGLILTSQMGEPVAEPVPVEVPSSDAAIVAAAEGWLALTDAGDWEASFDATGRTFKQSNTLAGWTNAATQVRGPQGAFLSRELQTIRFLNAPPHGYQEVVFATRYANADVIETVTLQEEEGEWKVVGIMVD